VKNLKFYIFLSILVLFQISFFSHFENFSSVPNVFTLLLIWMAFNSPPSEGYKVAIFGGFFLDMFSIGQIGTNILSLAVFVALLSFATTRIIPRDTAFGFRAGFYLVSLLAYELIYLAVAFAASLVDPAGLVSFGQTFGISFFFTIGLQRCFNFPDYFL